ncbi:MAG: ATP-binding protein [Pseudomonadota bacterium]
MSMDDGSKAANAHDARLQILGSMASGIAHEINTPIQFVGDNLQFISSSFEALDDVLRRYAELQSAVKDQPALQAHLKGIDAALEEAEIDFLREELPGAIDQSLSGIQQVARIASAMKAFAHGGGPDKELADVNQSIEMTVAICRNEWKYQADLDLQLDQSLPALTCHIGELSQVWLNLIVNAAQAIKANEAIDHGLITITTTERDGAVEVTVADNGVGIANDVKDRIFDPFFSTKEMGQGSGQGLNVCREIVCDSHGGEISVASEPDRGAAFSVRLPIDPIPALPVFAEEGVV